VPIVATYDESDAGDASYFVDLVGETLENRFRDHDFQNEPLRVYTTLDSG
jgi:hypothetical protein